MSAPPRSTASRRGPVLFVLAVVAAAAVAAAGIVFALRVTYYGAVLPGTRVAGIDLGGASAEEARRRLRGVIGADRRVAIRAAGRTYRVRPSDAGYRVDLDATVQQALDAGRGSVLATAAATIRGFARHREVEPVARLDRVGLRREVADLSRRIDRPAFPGELRITRKPIAVRVVAPRTGRRVDRARLARLLERAVRRPAGTAVDAPVSLTDVASREAVERVAQAAETYLSKPLRLTGAGDPVVLGPSRMSRVLALETTDASRGARLGAGDKRLAALVAEVSRTSGRPALSAQISAPAAGALLEAKEDVAWSPREATVTVRGGRSGLEVRRRETAATIEAAIRAGRHRAPLRARRIAPALSREAARRVRSLIGTFTTRYEPGQPRVVNIRRIARAVDATLIAPGAQFSLNALAGARTLAKGYVPAPFIAAGNKLEDSVGGGVSQFSTTMYNAAYFAGLRIDSHTPHSLYISRYPPGRESTLNFGSIDLAWTNDTATPVLIRATSDATSVTVSLYGDNGGRQVRAVSGPRQPVRGGDFSVVVTRVVRFRDGNVRREPFTTRYGTPAAD